jgi:hypothetical protein
MIGHGVVEHGYLVNDADDAIASAESGFANQVGAMQVHVRGRITTTAVRRRIFVAHAYAVLPKDILTARGMSPNNVNPHIHRKDTIDDAGKPGAITVL